MARKFTWLVLGLSGVVLLGGCEDPKQPVGVQNAAPPAPAGGPPAPAPMGGAPAAAGGHAGGGTGASGGAATTSTTAPAPVKDGLVYLPANVTFAVGGVPAGLEKSPNKVAAAVLGQFSPLTRALEKIGLPAQGVQSFWAAGNADLSEQALCVITAVDINQEAVKQALGTDKIPKESRVWPLPGAAAATHGLAVADSRTLIIGRKTTVESALRKSPALLIKQGLGTINQADSSFWMAGDSAAAQTYFSGGLPLLGRYRQPFASLKAFGIGIVLEGHAGTSATGDPMTAGMTTGGGHGGTPTAAMMPMPAAGGHAAPMPAAGGHVAATGNKATPMPMAVAGGHGAAAANMAGMMPNAQNAAPVAMAVSTEQVGIVVTGGFLFATEAAATTAKAPLDQFLSTAARKRIPKTQRYIPDLLGASGSNANGTGAMGGAYPTPGKMTTPMPNAGGGPSGSQSNQAAQVAVIPEPPNPANATIIDPRLQPTTPPQPQTVSETAAPAAGAAPSASPMGGIMAVAPPMTPMTAPTAMMANMMAAGGGGMQGGGGQWTYQQAAFVQFAYRFDASDENIAFAGHLMHALGMSPFGEPGSDSPLASLHKALQEARGPANTAGGQGAGFGNRGTSWMVHLLPFLGRQALHKQWDPKKPITGPANYKFSHAVVPEFLNPADPRQQWVGAPYADFGLTHFVGMSGVEDETGPAAATLDRTDPKAGIFGYKQIATPEMITDGQSQTIMMLGGGDLASPWAVGGGATIRGARSKSFAPQTGFGSVGGPKPGTFVLFADGSVRFVSADIDESVFKAMSTTHGQDSVDLPALQGAGTVIGK